MKKKITFVVFITFAAVTYGQNLILNDVVLTSEGYYAVLVFYEGKYMGQNIANSFPRSSQIHSITNGQSEAIWNVLHRYRNSVGDTFVFALILNNNPYSHNNISISVVVEMTSTSTVKYWAFYSGNY